MPLFYFDIQDRDGFHRDDVGDDFEDFSQARDQAHALLPDIARSQYLSGAQGMIVCCIRDADGETVYRGELIIRGTILSAEASRSRDGGSMLR